MKEKIAVYVDCITFNHSLYIKNAMDGFCLQKTVFPYVCGIIDDHSTDGESEVILNYLEENFDLGDDIVMRKEETKDYVRIFAQHKTNKNCYFVVVLLKYNHYQAKKEKRIYTAEWIRQAKYCAFCEGDDYWIDSLKLQKQLDFMELHPEHSLCFCANQELLPSGEIRVVKRYERDLEVCPMNDIILGGGGFMATNSIFFRISLYVPYQTWAVNSPIGDLPIMLTLANNGLVGYLADIMCVYRVAAIGSWSSRVGASNRLLRKHHYDILRIWHQFDEWSGRKYHQIVKRKIQKNRMEYLRSKVGRLVFWRKK